MATVFRHRTPYEWHMIRCKAGDAVNVVGEWLLAAVVILLAIVAALGIGTAALFLLLELIGGAAA